MRTIVHLSDLHFGRVNEAAAEPLIRQVRGLKPDLVVISGDLTQRARTGQFQAAKKFLQSLPQPQIVVPGNHDVPAYNVFKRFLEPLKKYRLNISDDLLPSYFDNDVAVFGLNSTLSFTTKRGKLRKRDITYVCERFKQLPDRMTRIVVCHHPFDLPPSHSPRDLIRSSSGAMRAFAECRVDFILSGHLHRSHISQTTERYRLTGYSALIVQAGTAISSRYRGERNSFNILRLKARTVVIEKWVWNAKRSAYGLLSADDFRRTSGGWVPRRSADSK